MSEDAEMNTLEKLIAKLCPNGVEYKPLGEVCNYSVSRVNATEVNANTYVSVENLLQDCRGRVNAESVPVEGRLIAYQTGDVLLGNIRPNLKKIWLANVSGGTNGDVLVVRCKSDKILLSEYLYYVLSSDDFFLYDMSHAKGAKMPRGDKSSIMKYVIPLPPLLVQREIVRMLDEMTGLIDALEEELSARKQQYEWSRDKLLKIEGVVEVRIESLVRVVTPSIKIKRDDYKQKGNTPIVSQEADQISGYCKVVDAKIPLGEYLCFGDHSEHLKYVDFRFVQGADGLKILSGKDGEVNLKYLYYAAQARYRRKDNYERHFKYFADTTVPVPRLAAQIKIARKLDDMTNLIDALDEEIALRKQQYEYYRDKLLTFKKAS